jgi:hypothetical protein
LYLSVDPTYDQEIFVKEIKQIAWQYNYISVLCT